MRKIDKENDLFIPHSTVGFSLFYISLLYFYESSEIYDSDYKRTGCVPEGKWCQGRHNAPDASKEQAWQAHMVRRGQIHPCST